MPNREAIGAVTAGPAPQHATDSRDLVLESVTTEPVPQASDHDVQVQNHLNQGLAALAAVRIELQLYTIPPSPHAAAPIAPPTPAYLLDLRRAAGDAQSFMTLTARVIAALLAPAAQLPVVHPTRTKGEVRATP
jgi:hypothetical protein